jgi:hypothetical protein
VKQLPFRHQLADFARKEHGTMAKFMKPENAKLPKTIIPCTVQKCSRAKQVLCACDSTFFFQGIKQVRDTLGSGSCSAGAGLLALKESIRHISCVAKFGDTDRLI